MIVALYRDLLDVRCIVVGDKICRIGDFIVKIPVWQRARVPRKYFRNILCMQICNDIQITSMISSINEIQFASFHKETEENAD